jgi:hypothetical protein
MKRFVEPADDAIRAARSTTLACLLLIACAVVWAFLTATQTIRFKDAVFSWCGATIAVVILRLERPTGAPPSEARCWATLIPMAYAVHRAISGMNSRGQDVFTNCLDVLWGAFHSIFF